MRKHAQSLPSGPAAQFTVRGVPAGVQKALRRKAQAQKKSLNRVLVEALCRDAGPDAGNLHHDLDHLAGTWEEDSAFDRALAAQDRVDKDSWR